MAYILKEILNWRSEVQEYWETEIDNSIYDNKESLKTDLTTYLDTLETDYQSYINSSSVSELKNTLNPIFSYATLKYNIIFPDEAPSIPDLITNDDLRNLYNNWDYTLPSDYSTIFNLTDDGDPGTNDGVLEKDTGYNSVQDTITNGNGEDNTELESFRNDIPNAIQDLMIYQTYKQPKIDMKNLNMRCYVLQELHLKEILDEFGFDINGVNQNVDPC